MDKYKKAKIVQQLKHTITNANPVHNPQQITNVSCIRLLRYELYARHYKIYCKYIKRNVGQ